MEQTDIIGNILSFVPIESIKCIALVSGRLSQAILENFIFNPKVVNKPSKDRGCESLCHSVISIPLFDCMVEKNRSNAISLFKNVHQRRLVLNYCLLKGAHNRALKILESNPDLADNNTMFYAAKGNHKDVVSFLFDLERFKNNKIGNIVLFISVSNSYVETVVMVLKRDFLDLEKGRKDLLKPDLNIKFPVDFLYISLRNPNKEIEKLIVDYYIKKCPNVLLLSINTRIPSLYALEKGYVHIISKEHVNTIMSILVVHYSQKDILRYLNDIMQNGILIGDCTKVPTRKILLETGDDLPILRVVGGEIMGVTDQSTPLIMNVISKEKLKLYLYEPSQNILQASINHFRYKIVEYLLRSKITYNGLGVLDTVDRLCVGDMLGQLDNKNIKNATECIKVLLKDDRTDLRHNNYMAIKALIGLNLIDVIELIVRDNKFTKADIKNMSETGLNGKGLSVFLTKDMTKDSFIKGLRTWSFCLTLGNKIIKEVSK